MHPKTLTTLYISLSLALISSTCMAQSAFEKEIAPAATPSSYRWWNLLHYEIELQPDYNRQWISGTNQIRFCALHTGNTIRIDLMEPMQVTTVRLQGIALDFKRLKDYYLIHLPSFLHAGDTATITIHFEGYPQVAHNPPWESGWIWQQDQLGRPWMSIACEGTGAAIWLPCKNVLYDKPDQGISMKIRVPDTLVAVSNGRLASIQKMSDHTAIYTWVVINPISQYNIIPYIGKYISWHNNYTGLKGNLDCDFLVLDYNSEKAKHHLQQTDTMLHCFEGWLGPYPFYEDSYKLVEAPMPGMEHQSAIAYGNGFENGYSGKNLSGTSWGLKWDFILIHESGHEWFGNSITSNGDGGSWIHEGFTKYLETLYTQDRWGTEAGNDYTAGISKRIHNDAPVITGASSDAYNKTAAMLHMLRQLIGDSLFRSFLQHMNTQFYHATISSEQVISYINRFTIYKYKTMLDQYLRTTQIPQLSYYFKGGLFRYRWENCITGFDMPVKVSFNNDPPVWLYPVEQWKEIKLEKSMDNTMKVDRNFYIKSRSIQDQ